MGTKDEGLGSLFGMAKKWLKNEVGTDPDANEGAVDDMKREASRQRDAAVVDAIMPEGMKQADRDARKAQELAAKEAEARKGRVATVGGSHLTLHGTLDGSIDSGLSVKTERADGTLLITVAPVDPAPLQGGSFAGTSFAVAGYTGPGTYDLGEPDDPLVFELLVDGVESEGFFWSPSYGPGVVTVSADEATADVNFVYEDPGSNRIELKGQLTLN